MRTETKDEVRLGLLFKHLQQVAKEWPSANRIFQDRESAMRAMEEYASQQLSALQQENQSLKVDRDEKEVMIAAFDKVKKLFKSYSWIMEGRGPYSYDDERYRKEMYNLSEEFTDISIETFENIKTKTTEYKHALMKEGFDYANKMLKLKVEGLQQENEKLRESLANKDRHISEIMIILKDVLPASGIESIKKAVNVRLNDQDRLTKQKIV